MSRSRREFFKCAKTGHKSFTKINISRLLVNYKSPQNTLFVLNYRAAAQGHAVAFAMFSPEAAGPASIAARNPRRRQRTASDDSVAVRPNPKRIRRSNLTHETFLPPDSTKLNGHVSHAIDSPYTNGHAQEPGSQQHSSADSANLALRHKSSTKADTERKSARNDGAVELVRRPYGAFLRVRPIADLYLNRRKTRIML